MKKQVLFIQGGGHDGYEADRALAGALQDALGKGYEIHYPRIKTDESAPDYGWCGEIGQNIAVTKDGLVIVGHSFGASMILKYLSQNTVKEKPAGVFLMATPFWSGDEDWQKALILQDNFAAQLPEQVPLFFYHCRDDEEVPFSHLAFYKQKLAQAIFREMEQGGHQLGNDLTLVANDIRSL